MKLAYLSLIVFFQIGSVSFANTVALFPARTALTLKKNVLIPAGEVSGMLNITPGSGCFFRRNASDLEKDLLLKQGDVLTVESAIRSGVIFDVEVWSKETNTYAIVPKYQEITKLGTAPFPSSFPSGLHNYIITSSVVGSRMEVLGQPEQSQLPEAFETGEYRVNTSNGEMHLRCWRGLAGYRYTFTDWKTLSHISFTWHGASMLSREEMAQMFEVSIP